MKDVAALIDDILAIDELLPSTQEDLEDFKRDLAENQLGKDDREYIAALHERLVGGGAPAPVSSDDDDDEAYEDDEDDQIDGLEAEIEQLKQTIAERDERIVDLERQLQSSQSTAGESESA